MKKNASEKPCLASDGSQFLRLSAEYFDTEGLRGISLGARILFKYMTVVTFWKQNFYSTCSREFLSPAGMSKSSLDKYLPELERVGYLKCYRTHKKPNRYKIADALLVKEGGFHLACQPIKAASFSLAGLSLSEQYLYEYSNFRALCLDKRLYLVLKVKDLMSASGLSSGTVKRARNKLHGLRLWLMDGDPKSRTGNEYFVNPALIWGPKQFEIVDYWDAKAAFDSDHSRAQDSDHFRALKINSDHFRARFGSFLGTSEAVVVPEDAAHSDHFWADPYPSSTSLPDGAPHHFAPNGSEGGVHIGPSEGDQRSPNGQDQGDGEKGGPSGFNHKTYSQAAIGKCDELAEREKTKNRKRNREPLVEGGIASSAPTAG